MQHWSSLALFLAAFFSGPSAPLPEIAARAETEPVTSSRGDRADDAAIWRNPVDPAASLILSTDKKAGIAIHDLDGQLLAFHAIGHLNNVDLRGDIEIAGQRATLVAASDRTNRKRPKLHLFRLDAATPRLVPIGLVEPARGEAYGLCLHRRGDEVDAFMVYKEGVVEQIELDLIAIPVTGRTVRRFDFGSRSEGCVADDRLGHVYIAEDKVAIWRVDTAPERPMAPRKFAAVDGVYLHKDAEGLALLPRGRDEGLLFAASQGHDSFAVFRLPQGIYAGGFRIGGGAIDGTEGTDGIALSGEDFGPQWPGGLFVAQDAKNRGTDRKGRAYRAAQNFKIVALGDIVARLEQSAR